MENFISIFSAVDDPPTNNARHTLGYTQQRHWWRIHKVNESVRIGVYAWWAARRG
jgi:hypothetical protein